MEKKKIIMILCIALLVMTVGYAALSRVININGTAEITSTWNLQFTNISATGQTDGATEINTPNASGTTATFHVGLKAPGDEITYLITLSNLGSINAVISEITASELGNNAIKFEVTDIAKGDKIAGQSEKVFKVKINFDSSVTEQPSLNDNKIELTIKCVQDLSQTITPGELEISKTRLAAKILSDNIPQSDASLDFDKTSEEDGTNGLYYTSTNTENNRTTYYFRGAVDNNYVKFGKEPKTFCTYNGENVLYVELNETGTPVSNNPTPSEDECKITQVCDAGNIIKDSYGLDYRYAVGINEVMCPAMGGTYTGTDATYGEILEDIYWRIIRINEDGSIRLIYQGNSADAKGNDASIPRSAYNTEYKDNAYVGYMYGTPGSDNYEDTHANENDSTIKGVLDDWYVANLSSYASYLADPGFCNDRSVSPELWTGHTGLGYGTNDTDYGAIARIFFGHDQPQFKCPNASHDLFTLSTNTKGNKALTHPIGLITADEVVYAGGNVGSTNSTFYLNTGTPYWTMSPENAFELGSYVWGVDDGFVGTASVANNNGVFPVINLRADVEIISGDGTVGSEYVIKTN